MNRRRRICLCERRAHGVIIGWTFGSEHYVSYAVSTVQAFVGVVSSTYIQQPQPISSLYHTVNLSPAVNVVAFAC